MDLIPHSAKLAISPPVRPPLPPLSRSVAAPELVRLVQATAEAHAALADTISAANVAMQRARSLTIDLEAALSCLAASDASAANRFLAAPTMGSPFASLSPREREVLALVAEGQTNKAIAETLFVSPNTVKTHVASLLNKMNAGSRTELATLATRGEGVQSSRRRINCSVRD